MRKEAKRYRREIEEIWGRGYDKETDEERG